MGFDWTWSLTSKKHKINGIYIWGVSVHSPKFLEQKIVILRSNCMIIWGWSKSILYAHFLDLLVPKKMDFDGDAM